MGNHCGRPDHDDSTTKTVFSIGTDYEELKDQVTGEGIKQTPVWRATITRSQLERKREEFWKTRTGGKRRAWYTLRAAVETDHLTALMLLEAAEIAPIGNSITSCKDSDGFSYEIPVFIVNNPIEFLMRKKKNPKAKAPIEETVQIRIRRSDRVDDIEVSIESAKTAVALKGKYADLEGIPVETVRLFFNGKELKGEETLGAYEIRSAMVVQAFVKS